MSDWTLGAFEYMGAAGDPVLESTGNNADGIAPMWLPGVATPSLAQETPRLASLFQQAQAEGPVIRYMKVVTRNAPADAVTVESQQKPGAEFAFDDVTVTLQKLAAFIPVSEEMLEDSSVIAAYINAQLPFMVASGRGQEARRGDLRSRDGRRALDHDRWDGRQRVRRDRRRDQGRPERGSRRPDALFINPTDWWTLRVKKNDAWGLLRRRTVRARARVQPVGTQHRRRRTRAPAGFPLVGNFQQGGQVFRKGGIRLEMSNVAFGLL